MSKVKFDKSKVKKFFYNNGIYIAFAVIMFAAGTASYFFSKTDTKPEHSFETAEVSQISETKQSVQKVQNEEKTPEKQTVKAETKVESNTEQNAAAVEKNETEIEESSKATFFVLPVSNGEILKDYSEKDLQYSNTYKDWRMHTAIDFTAEKGEDIKSAGHGKIEDIITDPLLGQTVIIDHGNGIIAYYCGITASPALKKGDIVTAGTKIGIIDSIPSESVDSSHLHLIVKVNGTVKNPIEIMGFKG